MCGRYWVDESPELRSIVEEMNRSPLVSKFQGTSAITTSGEIRPTNVVPVIASNKAGARTVYPMRWGFKTERSLLINARTETAATKPTFREAWMAHRCIIPASYYFESEHYTDGGGKKKTGDMYRLQPRDCSMTWLCGLYRIEEGLPVFVILTREPSENIRFIHDRMPLMMPEDRVGEWIKPATRPENMIEKAISDIVFEKAS